MAVAAARKKPVDKAARNKVFAKTPLDNFNISTIQNTKKPGAKKSSEAKKLSSVFDTNSLG